MDIKLLEDFLCLARIQNFSRSADERCVTQPAFSRRIKALETWAGTALIDREAYPVKLTPAGVAFKEIAENILRQLYQGKEEVNAIGWAGSEPITIISAQALALHFFPAWLKKIQLDYTPTEMSLMPDSLYNGIEALIQGNVDFMLAFSHPSSPVLLDEKQFPYCQIARDRYFPVSAVTDDGGPKFNLPGTKSSPVPFLAYPANVFLGKVVLSMFGNMTNPVFLKRLFENPMANGLKSLAIHGFGVAWLPESIIKNELDSNTLVQIGGKYFETELEIRLYKGDIKEKPAAQTLWKTFLHLDNNT